MLPWERGTAGGDSVLSQTSPNRRVCITVLEGRRSSETALPCPGLCHVTVAWRVKVTEAEDTSLQPGDARPLVLSNAFAFFPVKIVPALISALNFWNVYIPAFLKWPMPLGCLFPCIHKAPTAVCGDSGAWLGLAHFLVDRQQAWLVVSNWWPLKCHHV